MKRIYMVVVLALVAISAHAQLKDNLYTKSVKTFSLQDKYVNPNGKALKAAALRGDVKEVDKILKKVPFLVNDPLTVYPKMKSAQPLMCELINQGKKEVVNVFFKHGFVKNHKCPNGKGQTDVMTLLGKTSNPNMYCYLLSKKDYSVLIRHLTAPINANKLLGLPCLSELMEKNNAISGAVLDKAKKGNYTALKFEVAHLAKHNRPITDIGMNVVLEQYIASGDQSLINPFYDKSVFTPAQWNKIAKDYLREFSFAREILPTLLEKIPWNVLPPSQEIKVYSVEFVENTYQSWKKKMAKMDTATDAQIYNIVHHAYQKKMVTAEREEARKQYEKELQQTLDRFGGNAKLAAKYTWAVKKGYSVFYFPKGVKLDNREVLSWNKRFEVKEYAVPVVVVVDVIDIDKEDCDLQKEAGQVAKLNLYVYNMNGTMVWSKKVPDTTHIYLITMEGGEWWDAEYHWLVRGEFAYEFEGNRLGNRLREKYLLRRQKLQQYRKSF